MKVGDRVPISATHIAGKVGFNLPSGPCVDTHVYMIDSAFGADAGLLRWTGSLPVSKKGMGFGCSEVTQRLSYSGEAMSRNGLHAGIWAK